MARREIKQVSSRVLAITVAERADLRGWLAGLAAEHRLTTLLAHCEDGAIWGVAERNGLALSAEAFPRGGLDLRWEALVQARLFGPDGEVLLWQGPTGWQARLRDDTAGDPTEHIDEDQLLWGTGSDDPARRAGPFLELVEGRRGIRHAPPLAGELQGAGRGRLRARHYIAADPESGVVRVFDSRLVRLEPAGGQQ
ncbi:MAG TPA: CRISPR-associated protein Csx19 [Chloroflexaceae bacterium]|nr:CRISPR-associated protein Csx19 [Chloroflexaceae bacterium]